MAHCTRLFIGEPAAFTLFRRDLPGCTLFRLRPGAGLVVLPLDEALQDRMHRLNGTGDWMDGSGPALSSTDFAFAARASADAPLAYIETDYSEGSGLQHAVLWRGGTLAIGPLTLDIQLSEKRPTSLWPINVVLRALGVAATFAEDEFSRTGLADYRTNDAIVERAARLS
ncbi:MAG TPA: hypothetical protein PK970_11030 [Hyphomicrobiaceae bacterium]|nr:hypothetical protein [Hyphomicrobiaceae bacterium]